MGCRANQSAILGVPLVCPGPIAIRKFWGLQKGAAPAERHGLVGVVQLGSQKVLGSNPAMILMLAFKAVNCWFPVCQRGIMTLTWQDRRENNAQPGSCQDVAAAMHLAGLL